MIRVGHRGQSTYLDSVSPRRGRGSASGRNPRCTCKAPPTSARFYADTRPVCQDMLTDPYVPLTYVNSQTNAGGTSTYSILYRTCHSEAKQFDLDNANQCTLDQCTTNPRQ
jgi:hypothetical protein